MCFCKMKKGVKGKREKRIRSCYNGARGRKKNADAKSRKCFAERRRRRRKTACRCEDKRTQIFLHQLKSRVKKKKPPIPSR